MSKSEFAEFTDAEMGTVVMIHRNWGRADEEIAEIIGADVANLQRWVEASLAASAAVYDELYGGDQIGARLNPQDAPIEQTGGITQGGIVCASDHTYYTLEVTLGDKRHSFMMTQRYASEGMAARDYLAIRPGAGEAVTRGAGVIRATVVRHTQDASKIIHSWENP